MVTVPELVAAVAAAVSVIVSVAPGVITTDAGFAVTPAGNPAIEIAISASYPFTAVDVTVICCVAPPAVSATLAGATASVKSSSTTTSEPQPPAINATQPNIRHPSQNNRRPLAANPAFHPLPTARVEKIMRLLPVLEVKIHSPAIDGERSEINSPIPPSILPQGRTSAGLQVKPRQLYPPIIRLPDKPSAN